MTYKALIALTAATMAVALPASAGTEDEGEQAARTPSEQSQFVGEYNGSSFETAMGMVVRADGTFQWGLSVGGLDLRAKGTWFEEEGTIIFVSDPKPVPPDFVWAGSEPAQDAPFLKIIFAKDGRPFSYANVRGLCANGELVRGPVLEEGWSPTERCDTLETIQFYMQSYNVLSKPIELSGERAVKPGETIRIEFHPNDIGVANFDGVMGRLVDGKLQLVGGPGEMTLRKVTPPQP